MHLETDHSPDSLTQFFEHPWDVADPDPSHPVIVGDSPGEGVSLFLPIPKAEFASQYLDTLYDMPLTNNSSFTVLPDSIDEQTGAIANLVPEPAAAHLLLTLVAAWSSVRSRRPTRAFASS